MIAFALIAIGCVPVAIDLIREILSIPNWAATPKPPGGGSFVRPE